jgi:hypothetical protein
VIVTAGRRLNAGDPGGGVRGRDCFGEDANTSLQGTDDNERPGQQSETTYMSESSLESTTFRRLFEGLELQQEMSLQALKEGPMKLLDEL